MITHFEHGRSSMLVISLDECPWLAGTDVQLPGHVYRDFTFDMQKGKRSCTIGNGVKVYCFESTDGNYVVEVNYPNTDEADKELLRTALETFAKELYTPKSCVVDPVTGRSPSKVSSSSEWDDFI